MTTHLKKEGRELLLKVFDYFKKEQDNGGSLVSVNAVQKRTADALGVSAKTVSSVCALRKSGSDLTPRQRVFPKRKWLHLPATIKKEDLDLQKQTIERVCASSQVVSRRNAFLRRYLKNVNSLAPSQFVFIDETWVFSKGSTKNSWQDNSIESLQQPAKASDGKRYIIVHARTKNGFIEGASLIVGTKNKSLDYHDNMRWFKEQVLKKLEEPLIIILDHASFHSRKSERYSTAAWNLLGIANNNIVKGSKYIIDELAAFYGHEILWLPPYHCHFNPIELIWGIAKNHYDKTITSTSGWEKDVLQPWKEALDQITPEVWRKCVHHTETIIENTYQREKVIDEVRPLVFIKRLIPFLNEHYLDGQYVFWPDMASSHYAKDTIAVFKKYGLRYIPKTEIVPNVFQLRPIEHFW
ncbi:hypothetical protein ILUMI_13201 [Ignelater luminosus]|uniref:Tc1-like transposase DDE domain-containing protein n=1 Tax=Ignelater luminosus TaxID=2038154 RepID=A0A8K0CZ03_IGNLU|nr:hypothetical protein ILUMI_13201 [Ignelater luminosus]